MKPESRKSFSTMRRKSLPRNKTQRLSIALHNEDILNIEEMMSKNKLKKFREIGRDNDLNNSSQSQMVSK